MSAWLKPEQAEKELQVSREQLYDMVRNGQFDPRHLVWTGQQVRIHKDAIHPVSSATQPEPLSSASVLRAFAEIKNRIAEIEAAFDGQDIVPAHVSPIRRRA